MFRWRSGMGQNLTTMPLLLSPAWNAKEFWECISAQAATLCPIKCPDYWGIWDGITVYNNVVERMDYENIFTHNSCRVVTMLKFTSICMVVILDFWQFREWHVFKTMIDEFLRVRNIGLDNEMKSLSSIIASLLYFYDLPHHAWQPYWISDCMDVGRCLKSR